MSALPVAPRYILVAGACMVAHNAIMIGGDAAGLAMPVAVAVSFCVCVLLGFALHSRFTFAAKGEARALLRYTAAMALNLPATILLLWLFFALLRWPMALAAPAGTLVLLIVNFFASRWAIAARRPA